MAVLDALNEKLNEVFVSLNAEREQIADAIANGSVPAEEVAAFTERLNQLKAGIEGLVEPGPTP